MGFQKTAMPPEAYELCTREQAAQNGRMFFFTGKPCKHGHIEPRYVSTSGCIGCLHKYKKLFAKNPFTKDKVPFDASGLWVSKRLNQEQRIQLGEYIQKCVDTFEAHVLPKLCEKCQGARYVPAGNGRNDWVLCTACAVDEPSTADVPTGTTP